MTTLIHPTAVIHSGATVHPTVSVGPYAVIGENVTIGANTTIGSHVVLEGWTEIGERNEIFPGAAIGLAPQDLKYDGGQTWVRIGNDNCIREYVTINRATAPDEATVIGDRNLLMAYVHVAHNCLLENEVIVANCTAFAGHVHVESKARISGLLGVHQFVHIGQMAMVGGMSRIERDVPPYMTVEGNPARVRSLNAIGLKRSGLTQENFRILKEAYRMLYRSDLTFQQALEQLNTLPKTEQLTHLHQFLHLSVTEKGRRGPIPGNRD
ncbi:acyl-ACP--UDP-N-acetylglucosamine O-acyltransferase [Roseofilum reptotaenium CS-1145]|uniref:Acyl-[acyl-carrier-protein]--UDP-N-acetylglucosamine O-acyltransferase n=1 Tax=Roseofilum reptotaenium AO1-A TaxID=1925591 RepID=A0A1L9QTN0_9CYAN|nr:MULTISPECIES: acyl-ACP--UDP-N-acetylglucosamine O-acyltransferase [Roseofilum]MBP0028331.1 acyl-ACP--UDP-N-acetylglucosamine O-acyltransferase [Roseofilum sp. Guam]MDB9518938.1 acyl-ACP--UDP-N-acetylglucosamine O-acyltransferase [Roseofilum reptotaenium CS-1145]OJJ25947.1 acyl-[acyl-carrier-protein]--UDP-N-acetylglucosamine O-acyltransferase [Roseofilum reptotaenium AO1-A]